MPEYPWLIYRMSEGPLTVKEVHQGVNEQLNRKLGTDWGYSEYEWANLLQGFRPLPIRTASGTIAHFSDGADSVPMKSVVANIVPVQSGSGTPSPSNPRPISGTSELTLKHKGKNLFDPNTEFSTLYVYAVAKNVLPSATCTMSFTDNDTTQDISGVYFGFVSSNYTGGTPTVYRWGITSRAVTNNINNALGGENMTGLFYYPNNSKTLEKVLKRFKVQIELGNTATTYEPYAAETYTFDLGQEILGGTADVVGSVGTKTHGRVDLGSLTWTYHPASGQYSDFFDCYLPNDSIVGSASVAFDGYFEIYKSIPSANIALSGYDDGVMALASGTRRFIVCDQRYTSAEALKTALNGKMLDYPLATPTDFTFTGQPINSLEGVNNVWTDSGEVLDVEYRANF